MYLQKTTNSWNSGLFRIITMAKLNICDKNISETLDNINFKTGEYIQRKREREGVETKKKSCVAFIPSKLPDYLTIFHFFL